VVAASTVVFLGEAFVVFPGFLAEAFVVFPGFLAEAFVVLEPALEINLKYKQ